MRRAHHKFSGGVGRPRVRRAFTLLEAMMALVIIGVGVLAFVDAQSAFTRSNSWSSQSATGMLLANEVREFSRRLSRHDPVTGLTIDAGGALQGWGREAGEVDVSDIDDLDDLDALRFGQGGNFAGPIDAFGEVIPEVTLNGDIETLEGQVVPMQGWSQRVIVEKVDPYNFSTVRAHSYQQVAGGGLPAVRVDSFPLRITVIVEYQPVGSTQAQEITRLTWVVPAS